MLFFNLNFYQHKFRKPSIDGMTEWPIVPSDASIPISFLKFDSITSKLRVETKPELEDGSIFWLNFRKHFQFDLIQNKKFIDL